MKRINENSKNRESDTDCMVPMELVELYANRKPVHDENCIYRLRVRTYGQLCCYDEAMAYPKFAISNYCDQLYRSLEEAKAAIDKMISVEERQDLCYFTVTQIELGHSMNQERATWLFDRESQLLDYSVGGRFFGRTPERTRFKKGDIVEVITDKADNRFISLAVIVDTPPCAEECWKLFNKSIRTGENYRLRSYEDDCYMVADTPGVKPKRVQSASLLPTRFPVDDSLKAYFEQCLYSVNTTDNTHDDCRACIESEERFVVGGLHIYIEADSDTHTPLLHLHNRDDSFHTRLRIDCAKYFRQSDDRLTERDKSALVEFLTTVQHGRPRWWYLLRGFLEWHNEYDNQMLFKNTMPEYLNLPD